VRVLQPKDVTIAQFCCSVILGTEPLCGSAESILVSSECGCRLSTLWFGGFACAVNDRFPPDLDIECAAANGRDGWSADLRCQREMTAQVCQSRRSKGLVSMAPEKPAGLAP
jgi:hypothetical protein